MKRWMGIVLLMLYMFIQILPGNAYAAGNLGTPNYDVYIEGFEVMPNSPIYKGQTFKIRNLKIKNKSGAPINKVSLIIDENQSSSFQVKNKSSIIYACDTISADGLMTICINPEDYIEFIYNGGENTRLPITINYAEGSTSTYITIDKAVPQDTSITPPPTPVDTSKFAPKLSIVNGPMIIGQAGNSITIPLNIKNNSYEARNVIITPRFGEGEVPFEIETLNLSQSISKIAENGTEGINFKFKIAGSAKEKTYPIGLDFKFENAFGDSYDYSTTIYVKVTNSYTSPRLTIKNIIYTQSVIYPGGFTGVDISLINNGTLAAKDVKISLIGLKEDGFTLVSGTNGQYISQINGGEVKEVNFKLGVSNKLTGGDYGITVKLEYNDQSGKDYSEEQQFFIPVYSENTSSKTVPKIILSQYNCNPSIVRAGENFKLSMAFLNTNDVKEVRNIKIYFTANETSSEGGNLFTPVNSSNTFFIDSIAPKGMASYTIEFFTIPDAKAKTYTMTANFEYEDIEGNEYKSTELIGIPVQQKTRLETTEISFPPEAYPGQPFPVGFDLYNMGKVTLSNLMIKIDGDVDAPNSTYFIGNFEPGSSEHYEGTVIPRGPGITNGAVIISFDDPTGEHIELRKDFSFNTIEMPAPEPTPGDQGMEPGKANGELFKKLIKSPLFWIGIAAAAIIIGIFIRKGIIKRKGGMTLDE